MSSAAARLRPTSQTASTTRAPTRASSRATTRPSPELAPVMTTVRPAKDGRSLESHAVSTMGSPGTRYHHGDLPAAVLRRAEEVLRESGADGLSLGQLARDVGVSHAAPSRHFRDKQALLDALALVGFDRLGKAFADAITEVGTVDEQLYGLARAYLRFAMDNPALLALMFARKHAPTGGAEIADAVERAFTTPVIVIANAQRHGLIVTGDPQRIGMSVVASLQGLATFVGSGFVRPETADELLDETISHLLHGLRPRR